MQALCRGRAARCQLAAMHAAASTLAAVVRGWLARRWVREQLALPALLAAGIAAKRCLQAARSCLERHSMFTHKCAACIVPATVKEKA